MENFVNLLILKKKKKKKQFAKSAENVFQDDVGGRCTWPKFKKKANRWKPKSKTKIVLMIYMWKSYEKIRSLYTWAGQMLLQPVLIYFVLFKRQIIDQNRLDVLDERFEQNLSSDYNFKECQL